MDFLTLVMLVPIVAIIAGAGLMAFGKWTESRERIAHSPGTDDMLRRLERLEQEVAHMRGDLADRSMRPTGQVEVPDAGI